MKNIFLIANKELKTYIASPMAYIVSASFLAVTGFFFVASVSDAFAEASIRGFLAGAVFFLIFLSNPVMGVHHHQFAVLNRLYNMVDLYFY